LVDVVTNSDKQIEYFSLYMFQVATLWMKFLTNVNGYQDILIIYVWCRAVFLLA